ncbi:hypothetical protein EV361DRAFT_167180 [Lentinula raphanica]|nr:hypothetical protein EV361DRAFT_167180 [Lentinula raphanica]
MSTSSVSTDGDTPSIEAYSSLNTLGAGLLENISIVSASPFTMKIQLFQFRTVLLLAMSSALVLKTCYAYPLHAPGEPQDSQNSHTNAPVATIQPDRLPQLVSRGPPSFFKKIDKALGSDRKVLGFAYVKPGQELPPGGQSVNLDQLEIPVMRLHSNRDMLYLLTSRPKMKPQDPNNRFSTVSLLTEIVSFSLNWSSIRIQCVLYAVKSRTTMPLEMSYEERSALPAYDDESPPVYTSEPAQGHSQISDSATVTQPQGDLDQVKFFSHTNVESDVRKLTALEIPRGHASQWGVYGLCYKSDSGSVDFLGSKPADLPQEWKSKVNGWPEGREM